MRKPFSNGKITPSFQTERLKKVEYVLELLMKGVNEIPSNIEALVEEAIAIAEKLKGKKELCMLYLKWGYYWHRLEQYDKTKKYCLLGLPIAQKLQNNLLIAYTYNNLGLLNLRTNHYHKALEYLFQALSFNVEKLNPTIYSNIGTVFFEQKKFEKALEYYQKFLEIISPEEVNDFINGCINVGVALHSLGRYEEATKYYETSLQIMGEDEQFIDRKASCFENFGEIKLVQKEYEESLIYLQKALELSILLKQHRRITVCLRLIGKNYLAQNCFKKAHKSLQKSLYFAREHGFVVEEKETLKTLIEYYKYTKQLEECIDYQEQLIHLQSQYFYPEKKAEIEAMLDKKEIELEILSEKNQQIEQQNQHLQRYNRELKQYAYIVAHDLKEPLCNISGFTTLLNSKYKENFDQETLDFLKFIEGGTNYMHSLLEDLLQYSTLQLEKDKIVRINANHVLQKILRQLEPLIKATNASVQVCELPAVDIEPKHFRWLMTQIINNSLKFSHPDKNCSIFIHSYKKKGKQYIEVRDNGIGIDPVQQQKIFGIFQRLNKQNYEGTGIGLAICKKIIDLYGGEIGLQSKVDEGTAFYFSLPTVVISS